MSILSKSILSWLEQNTGNTYGNFINGEWIASVSGRTKPVYHAARQKELLGYFADSSGEDVNAAVDSAYRAFLSWSKTPAPERAAILEKFTDLLERDKEELAYRISAEQGKTLAESLGEVGRAAKEARFSAGEVLRLAGEVLPAERNHVTNSVVRTPLGVVAAIAPWNFPVVTPVRKIVPALAYGCTVVFKPASATPWAAAKLMELFAEARVPAGAVNMVTGSGQHVGDPLVKHPLVKGISFTGSTKQGLAVQANAAGRLARTQLELGGKNSAVVLDYGDLREAAKQIVSAAFACTGQRCTAISRVIVLKEQENELIAELIREMEGLKVGPAWEPGIHVGPLINKAQLETVMTYVQSGIKEGARLVCGGDVLTDGGFNDGALNDGNYMTPALFVDVKPDMTIAKEEIFGPVLSVITAENEKEAIEIANSTEYGLAVSVFTDRLAAAHRVAEQLQSGMVHINHGTASAAHLPFGGVKLSGFGSYSIGSSNQEFFTEMKVVYIQY